jgi:hypothetical protein
VGVGVSLAEPFLNVSAPLIMHSIITRMARINTAPVIKVRVRAFMRFFFFG